MNHWLLAASSICPSNFRDSSRMFWTICFAVLSQTASAASIDCNQLGGKAGLYKKTSSGWSEVTNVGITLGSNQFAFKPKGLNDPIDRNGVLVVKLSERYAVSGRDAEGKKSRNFIESRYPSLTVKMSREGHAKSNAQCVTNGPTLFPTVVKIGEYLDYHRGRSEDQKLKNFHGNYTADRPGGAKCLRTDSTVPVPNEASASRSNRDQYLFDENANKPFEVVARLREIRLVGSAAAGEAEARLEVKNVSYDLGVSAGGLCPKFDLMVKSKAGVIQISDLEGRDDKRHFRRKYIWNLR